MQGFTIADEADRAELLIANLTTVSVSHLQRHLKCGYHTAVAVMAALEARGLVGPGDGARPRLVTR